MANSKPNAAQPVQSFEALCSKHSLSFPAISAAREATDKKIAEISRLVTGSGIELGDTLSLLVFGSIARREWTSGSDVDWTLLVDGPVNANHLQTANEIKRLFEAEKLPPAGATGIFGTLASSHDLVHHVGGLEDTNRNMTRRLLLLLESRSIGGEAVRDRVLRAVLDRYIVCGRGVSDIDKQGLHVPRFLLNDIVRYWRTIAVDYAAKKWEKADEGWALRNAKLRVKGLLLCFDCELLSDRSPWIELSSEELVEKRLVLGCRELVELTPIDLLSRLFSYLGLADSAKALFSSYSSFLELINDEEARTHLKELTFDDASTDETFRKVRKDIGQIFADELEKLFFNSSSPLTMITQKYGVF